LKIWTVALVMLSALHSTAQAHELQGSRATLVLRDNQHLAVTFFVDYPAVLHQALAPQTLFHEFALQHSAMPANIFAAQLLLAQRKLQLGTRLVLRSGKTAPLRLWAWPDSAAAQKALQQRAIEAVVGGKDHAHVAHSEIRTEAQSINPKDMANVTLQLPVEFKKTLVVSYQPKQVWVEPGKTSASIRF
jgi:hypothetical protein